MFFILSKTVSLLFMPLTLIIISLIASFLLKNKRWGKRFRIFGLVLLLICSNSWLIGNLMKQWEVAVLPMDQIKPGPAVAVVLTGVVNLSKLPADRVYFYEGADRITHALQLYKEGKVQKIVVSGGTGSLWDQSRKEAPLLADFLKQCGVPASDVLVESDSRNTYESAKAVRELLLNDFPDHQYLLVTSAFHMRRAQATFKAQDIPVTCFSTDFKTSDGPPNILTFVVPSPSALRKAHILIRECMGFMAYKVAGYL